jgi:hypothetical protein
MLIVEHTKAALGSGTMITEEVDILLEEKNQVYYNLLSLLYYRRNVLHYISGLPGGGGCAWVAPFKVKAHYKIPCSSCWIV